MAMVAQQVTLRPNNKYRDVEWHVEICDEKD